MLDYYSILEVHPKASQEIIKKAYQILAKKYHPDTTMLDKEQAEVKFKELKDAYSILSDPEKRAKYDKLYFANQNSVAKSGNIKEKKKVKAQNGFNLKRTRLYHIYNLALKEIGYKNLLIIGVISILFICSSIFRFMYAGDKKEDVSLNVKDLNHSKVSLPVSNNVVNNQKSFNNNLFSNSNLNKKQKTNKKVNEPKNESKYSINSNVIKKPVVTQKPVTLIPDMNVRTGYIGSQYYAPKPPPTYSYKKVQRKNSKGITVERTRKVMDPQKEGENCKFIIDNRENNEPIYARLWSVNDNRPYRTFNVAAYDLFTLDRLPAGKYELRYKHIYTNGNAEFGVKSNTFELYKTESAFGTQYSELTITIRKVMDNYNNVNRINANNV